MAADHLFELDADLLALATELEGHPDNVAAALQGGFVVCADGRAHRFEPPTGLEAVLVVPHAAVRTKQARAALPAEVPMADAVFNAAHGALLMLGLARGDWDLVAAGLDDRLHQPRREHLYPRSMELVRRARDLGALGATISGAGPTVLVWCHYEQTGGGRRGAAPRGRGLGRRPARAVRVAGRGRARALTPRRGSTSRQHPRRGTGSPRATPPDPAPRPRATIPRPRRLWAASPRRPPALGLCLASAAPPPQGETLPAKNFAARAGRWSAAHRKTAIFGWLAFVIVAFVIGGNVGTKTLAEKDLGVGDSGRADEDRRQGLPRGRRRAGLRPEQDPEGDRPGLPLRRRATSSGASAPNRDVRTSSRPTPRATPARSRRTATPPS